LAKILRADILDKTKGEDDQLGFVFKLAAGKVRENPIQQRSDGGGS
jgi:hypothetical protein